MPDAELASINNLPGAILGIDPGIRGGAGLAVVREDDGSLLWTAQVGRDPGFSTIQMMRAVRDAILLVFEREDFIVETVAREDHVFPQQIERIARNILRRMNGVIDVCVCDTGFVEGESYFGFPVGSWKVLAGLPGDLGKETKAAEKGVTVRLGTRKKKGTPAQYLAAINALLGVEHKTVDEADAHAIAKAAWLVRTVRKVPGAFARQTHRAQESLWDKDRAGMTVHKALTTCAATMADPPTLSKYLREFAL